jgi:hypothetical protein
MKESSDNNDRLTLNSVYGALFFGVPSQGMDTEALAAMVGDRPQRYDLALLDQEVGHRLRRRQHEEFCKAFDFEDAKVIQFFETRKTSTVVEVGLKSVWPIVDTAKQNRTKIRRSGRVLVRRSCSSTLHQQLLVGHGKLRMILMCLLMRTIATWLNSRDSIRTVISRLEASFVLLRTMPYLL